MSGKNKLSVIKHGVDVSTLIKVVAVIVGTGAAVVVLGWLGLQISPNLSALCP